MRPNIQTLRDRVAHRLFNTTRRVAEVAGISRWSRPSAHGIEARLRATLPRRGFFVEAGGYDGFMESNTYYLERLRGWRGLLVEPMEGLCQVARKLRTRSIVVQAALMADTDCRETIEIHWGGAMSTAPGALPPHLEKDHLKHAGRFADLGLVRVPARTLSSILDEIGAPQVDFLSLDVEGMEMPALLGLDLRRHRPGMILVESLDEERRTGIRDLLQAHDYVHHGRWTPRDDCYLRRDRA